jgi:AbrB family looped-hinge helix DNA binding protein
MRRMAKVTSKYQVTLPKAIAAQYRIRPGDKIEWAAAGEAIGLIPRGRKGSMEDAQARLRLLDQATARHRKRSDRSKAVTPQDRGRTREELSRRSSEPAGSAKVTMTREPSASANGSTSSTFPFR